jgi:transketolase
VLPPDVPTLAVEAGTTYGWERWADDALGIDRFGASAPGDRVLAELGFTPEHVADRARQLIDDLEELA